jgi:hypothetical protein
MSSAFLELSSLVGQGAIAEDDTCTSGCLLLWGGWSHPALKVPLTTPHHLLVVVLLVTHARTIKLEGPRLPG